MSILTGWFSQHPEVRLLAGFVFFLAFGALYFRASRGAGKAVFVLIVIGLAVIFWLSPLAQLAAFPFLLAWLVRELLVRRSPRPEYHPAVAIVEGGGVKRGLTAPEAAVLLEMPLNTVLATVIVGLLKKGALESKEPSPELILAVTPDFRVHQAALDPQERSALRRAAAQKHHAILQPYDEPFLELFEEHPDRLLNTLNFTAPLRALVRHVARRVGGYDLEATREYYRKHLGRARHDVGRVDGDREGERLRSHHLEWLVLDPEFSDLYRDYPPPWEAPASGEPVAISPSGSKPGPGLAEWVEQLSVALAGSIPAGGLSSATPNGKRLALGGVDRLDEAFFRAVYAEVWPG